MQKQQLRTRKGDIKNYNIEAQIGHGASGICYRATSKLDGTVCAIKKISINTIKGNSLKLALKQVQVLKQLKHPNIIKYFDSFIDDGYLYIVMEYASKGDMHAMLKRRKVKQQFYTETQIWDMGRQLLQALKYLHQKNIVHRDFKTLNIFIGQKNNLLVGDLGVSKIIKNDMGLYSRVGTPLYLAPEIIKYEKYDYKADIWGFGCVMYVIAALSHPFQGKNIISLGQNILHSQIKPIAQYSDELNNFLRLALQKSPTKRANAKSLLLLYYSPQQQKSRLEKLQQTVSKNNDSTKMQIKQRLAKYSSLIDGSIIKKSQKITPKIMTQLQIKQKKQISKINNINEQQKILNFDQTIILQPPCGKIDQPHQKTRTRAIYNSSKTKIASNRFIQDNFSNNQKNVFMIRKNFEQQHKKNFEEQSLINYRSKREQKILTQAPETFKKASQANHLFRYRDVHSAKPRNQILPSTMCITNNQQSNKQFIVSSVSRMFFDSQIQKVDKEERKIMHRPKSSLGRKTFISGNEIKYIKKRKASEQHSLQQTKTQLLRKPQMIII